MRKPVMLAGLSLVMATFVPLLAASQDAPAGARLYAAQCSACHGANRAGIPGTFPALTDVGQRLDDKQIKEKIVKGGGLMPPFTQLSEKDIDDLVAFLTQK